MTDYEKLQAKLKASKQIYGRVRRMKMRAFWKDVEHKAERNKNYFVVSVEGAVGALSAAKQEEIKALCDAAQELAYKALGYIFDHTNQFKLSKPTDNGYDMLAIIDGEIYLIDSAKYELKYDFKEDRLVVINKEDGQTIDDVLLMLWSLKHEHVERLYEVFRLVKRTWRKNR